MNTWIAGKDLMENYCLKNGNFYSSLNLEDITDVDYRHAKECLKFLITTIQVSTMTCMFKVMHYYFQMLLQILEINEIYELDPACFLSAPGLAQEACFKKPEIRSQLLTDIDMLLMVEKGMCHVIHRYAKANNKYMNNYNKNKESSYIQYLHANNIYGWTMSQNYQ